MVELEFAAHALGVGLAALSIAGCGGTDPQACGGIGACVTTVAGSGLHGNVDGPAANAQFSMPHAVAIDAQSNVHVADYGNNNLTRVVSQGRVSTPLDDPTEFPNPADVATDSSGNSYVADTYGNRILKVTPAGETTVVAGTGQSGDADGGPGAATFSMPSGVAFDAHGALYVADMGNGKIRRITLD